ncbi:LEVG family PEP-CTERM protein [Fischerella thermalis]|uniref:LEVG family PEP-CTERM protein n=1 Tax=Fischerella thermalis TaxID=372787 RepID=UPI000C7FE5F8|nr:LEVG family PEP-CTERM protein [Fischerella thermalis]PLZ94180.1 PEP-CTERM sorting domain-containing protein [Fischerella thermalis CCMEE 5194]
MPKFNFLATMIGTVLGLGVVAAMPNAHAASLIPNQEGEIKTNLGCLDPSQCIDTTSLGYTVTSLDFDGAGGYGPSRLFVDDRATSNTYLGSGLQVSFGTRDAGTNTGVNEYWLRPVAITESGNLPESGQLEVGRFLFEFTKVMSEITLDFFDVEDIGTAVLLINNSPVGSSTLSAGKNNGIQTLTFYNVKSFEVQLGNAYSSKFPKYGDGVNLGIKGKAVPEAGTTLGLGALAVAGMFGLRQRKKSVLAG